MKDSSKIAAAVAIASALLLVYTLFYFDDKISQSESDLYRARLQERDTKRLYDDEMARTEFYRGFIEGARWRDENRSVNLDSLRKTMNLPKKRHLLKIY